tara:strand:+ start:31 stop:462 length:432 start_codon:yes stop_codon:yes gene_type:complete
MLWNRVVLNNLAQMNQQHLGKLESGPQRHKVWILTRVGGYGIHVWLLRVEAERRQILLPVALQPIDAGLVVVVDLQVNEEEITHGVLKTMVALADKILEVRVLIACKHGCGMGQQLFIATMVVVADFLVQVLENMVQPVEVAP